MLGGLCDFRRLVVSRVVGTGLIIAGGDCVSGLEGSFRGLRVKLSCGVVTWGTWGGGCLLWAGWPGHCGMSGGAGPGTWCLGPGAWGSGLPLARHGVGGLVRVLVSGWLLRDLRCVRRLLFFLGCWGVRRGGAVLFPCWGQPG